MSPFQLIPYWQDTPPDLLVHIGGGHFPPRSAWYPLTRQKNPYQIVARRGIYIGVP
jgi:hypothetical protein